MKKTAYSHAFLVGSFNGRVKPSMLDNDTQNWTKEIIPNSPSEDEKRYGGDKGYNGLCTLYYKAHIDAMIKAESQDRPKFLKHVCHYIHKIEDKKQFVSLSRIMITKDKDGKEVTIITHLDDYYLKIVALHIYFFPLESVFFAIEIDDSGSDFNSLTMGHSWLMNWIWEGDVRFCDNTKNAFGELLTPFAPYLIDKTLANIIDGGNKMKIFQIVKYETANIYNELLYELGTSSPIGCVGGNMWLTPSKDYYNQIIKENVVSAFKNWKGLALVDSFTILGTVSSFKPEDCIYMYFPLIYLRCIFEKTFCFSRNTNYREDKVEGNLLREIAQMEKYYFYNDISHNFLPNLLYNAMAKGLGINEERDELAKQIKEKEEKNSNLLLGAVSVFAIFSIFYDFYSLIKAWCAKATFVPTNNSDFDFSPILKSTSNGSGELPLFAFILSIVAGIATISVILYLKSQRRR